MYAASAHVTHTLHHLSVARSHLIVIPNLIPRPYLIPSILMPQRIDGSSCQRIVGSSLVPVQIAQSALEQSLRLTLDARLIVLLVLVNKWIVLACSKR